MHAQKVVKSVLKFKGRRIPVPLIYLNFPVDIVCFQIREHYRVSKVSNSLLLLMYRVLIANVYVVMLPVIDEKA